MDTSAVQEHFRVQVRDYAALMRRLIPFYDQQQDLILALIPFERDRALRILDLGCGTGQMAARLLGEFPRAHVTLFDLTAEMIEACRSRIGVGDRVTFQVGDFRADDFGTGYDVIVASLSLHHLLVAERPAFARRVHRALGPGGQLIAAEVIVDETTEVRQRQYELWRQFMTSQGEDGDVWYRKHLAKDHPVQISEWIRTLSDAGFSSTGCFWRYLNFAILSARAAAATPSALERGSAT